MEIAMNNTPDIEVVFEFNGTKKRSVTNGYRPNHLIKDDYLTTGVHQYYEVDTVSPTGSAKGTITFITPEVYTHCLWIGKRICIQEGSHIVGYATVTKIFNSILEIEKNA